MSEEVKIDRSFYKLNHEAQVSIIHTFLDAWTSGKPVYVRLEGKKSSRKGTIGIVDFSHLAHFQVTEEKWKALRQKSKNELSSLGHSQRHINNIRDTYSYRDYIRSERWDWNLFKLRMDDGKLVTPKTFDYYTEESTFVWLVDYEGPTESVFEKKDKSNEPKPVCKDRFGTELNIGDFIATTKGNALITGTIVKITASGLSAYVKSLNGKNTDMCTMGPNVVLIADETKTKAMLRKLSS